MTRMKETLRFIEMEWQIVWYWHLKRKLVKHMVKMADHLLTGDGATHRADAALRLDEKGRIASPTTRPDFCLKSDKNFSELLILAVSHFLILTLRSAVS